MYVCTCVSSYPIELTHTSDKPYVIHREGTIVRIGQAIILPI